MKFVGHSRNSMISLVEKLFLDGTASKQLLFHMEIFNFNTSYIAHESQFRRPNRTNGNVPNDNDFFSNGLKIPI